MATHSYRTCDRCGAETRNKSGLGVLRRPMVGIIFRDCRFLSEPRPDSYDLCDECTESLNRWLKEGKE